MFFLHAGQIDVSIDRQHEMNYKHVVATTFNLTGVHSFNIEKIVRICFCTFFKCFFFLGFGH